MGLKEVKRSKSFTSTLITAFIIFMLVLSGPAGAVSITITTLPSSITQGQDLTLIFRVDLDTGERIPISSYNITVYNSTWQQTFLVYPWGIGGPNVTVNPGSFYPGFDYGYGYRWGYGYGYDLSYYNYTFGYGYGYGYGYAAPGYETYNVTLNLSAFNLAAGTYYVNITIDTGDPSKIYSSPVYNFTIKGVPAPEVTAAPTAAGGGGVPPWLGARSFDITLRNVQDIVEIFFYLGKRFFVAPKELAGTLGSLDYMPTMSEFVARLNLILWKKVGTLVGDPIEIASEKALEKFDTANKVIIARGDTEYPHHGVDAMASVAYAKVIGAPILLVKPGELPPATERALSKLGAKEVVIVGGPVAVSEEVAKKLPRASRIWGKDRYETAVKIAEALMDKASVSTIVVADGLNPDVHAVMVAHYYRAPIVYVAGDEVPATTEAFLKKHKPNAVRRVLMVGLSDKAKEAVKKITS